MHRIITAIEYYVIDIKNFMKYEKLNRDFLDYLMSDDLQYINNYIRQACMPNMKEWSKHYQHPVVKVTWYDNVLKEYTQSYFTLTKSDSNIIIEPSLIDLFFNEMGETRGIIKISDTLYISGHSWISECPETELGNLIKLNKLTFDSNKGHYVYENFNTSYKKSYETITEETTKLLKEILEKKFSNNDIPQINLTNHINLEESLFMYQLLQLKAYEESEDKWNAIEQEWGQKLKYDDEKIKAYYKDKENKEIDNKNKLDE